MTVENRVPARTDDCIDPDGMEASVRMGAAHEAAGPYAEERSPWPTEL